ncbi:unnamed protein product [Candidula unifasciata]|uniref:Uncharacterized protein n=1 Tax=Candidula unifasciata TaxID=100452 RepID=A0A8S3YU79_9EUPU|nr:unnamed protein product [Candidula unifasciata]
MLLHSQSFSPDLQELFQSDIIDVQQKYAFTAEELFFSAKFENEDLNISEAFESTETSLGRCFTFNGPEYISKNGPRLTKLVGRESGLRLYVHLFQDQYFIFDDLTAGIRMFVAHHPDTPRLRQDGIDIHPGTSTRLALTPVKYTFLPAPYKSYGDVPCLDTDSQDLRHKMVNGSFYSYDNCMEQCHSYTASLACSCYSHLLYVPNLRRCTVGDLFCFAGVRENLTAADCDCPRPCSFVHYSTTLSASQIPSRVSADFLTKLVNVSSAAELRDNYLEIRVYLDTMMLRHERHEGQYNFSSIFAFLGGQMGFFIGASLITLGEILEAILLSVYTFFHKHLLRMGQPVVLASPPASSTPSTPPHVKPDKRRAW